MEHLGQILAATDFTAPPRQRPHEQAVDLAFRQLETDEPAEEQLTALGGRREKSVIHLPALSRVLLVDVVRREVRVEGGGKARPAWALLALHYLAAGDVAPRKQMVTLSHFSDCRGYLPVFEKRIIGRFLATVGRTDDQFRQAGVTLGAPWSANGGTAFTFPVLPRVPLIVIRYEADDEFAAGALVLYQEDARQLLPPEDRIVAAELLLDTLSGKPLDEK